MDTDTLPETPFSRALRNWISEVERDQGKKTLFYERALAAQNDPTDSNSGREEGCAKCAKDLSDYIQGLQKTRKDDSRFLRLCSKLDPFVESISRLMTICGTLAQAAPFAVSIAFAGAQVILQLASKQVATFEKMVDIMTEIARNLRCYDKLSTAYEATLEMQELLFDAYKTIIEFWDRAAQVLSRSSLKIAFTNLVKPIEAEWKICLDNLLKNSRGVLALAQATNAFESQETKNLDLTKKVAKWIIGGADSSKLLFQSDLTENQAVRQDGTCSWIFEQPAFKSWYEVNENTSIWYNAPPGSGKTVLSAAVAHQLETSRTGQVVYYRYSFDDTTRKSPLAALRSIALQLRTITGRVPERVVQCYKTELERHAYRLQAPDIAVEVAEAFIEKIPRLHIIVDGLDECCDVPKALRIFRRLIGFCTYGITKWFFTSRDEPSIRAFMEGVQALEIRPARGVIMNDIAMFLDAQGEKLAVENCSSCVRSWTAASEENFLYSKLMFNILSGEGVTCSDEIQEELQKFPPGLAGCYTRCLANLSRREKPERKLARRIFLFLVCAAKPLTVSELRNALAIMMEGEFDDHQPGRVPKLDTIKSLGGSLIRLESSLGDGENDWRIKFVHKSVLDFFVEDPDRLGIATDREDLRYFFISTRDGNREVGEHCLKYLSFKRYQAQVDVPTVLANNDEHAFLKYAAAFWFEHLNNVDHSQALFDQVSSFIKSPAFWVCLAAQVKTRPHLFARYTGIGGVAFALGLRRGELGKDVSIAVPLPDWVELYKPDGHEICLAFYNFVRNWHEVLVSFPEACSQCQLDRAGGNVLPGLSSMMSNSLRMSTIIVPTGTSAAALADVFFVESKLHARVTYLDGLAAWWQEGPVSRDPVRHGSISAILEPEQPTKTQLVRFGGAPRTPSSGQSTAWLISPSNLDVKRHGERPDTFPAPAACRMSVSSRVNDTAAVWVLVTESASTTEYGVALAFHFANESSEAVKRQDTDSGYGSVSAPGSPSDSGSDSGWSSSSDSDASGEEENEGLKSDCLVICCDGENFKPIWLPWSEQPNHRSQVSCAFHPIHRTAVFSRHLDELQIVDLDSGETCCRVIVEPAAARASAALYCREMRFSSCGRYLYYLLVLIADGGELGSTCQVFLSVFPSVDLESSESRGTLLQSCYETQHLTYSFGAPTNMLKAPYVLSYWDADTALYLCLPLLSCNPKVVRFKLQGLGEETEIQTLANPIFFPNSTPCRSPRILYRSSLKEKKDTFVLALSGLCLGTNETNSGYSPVVLEWKVKKKDGWRAWDEAIDSSELGSAEARTYTELRGTFIDADRRFNVTVRSGLDWKRKAFLSCA
ncbi:hypothetical protein DL770_005923 [Monosporascus sp. CRB-9-2]|nr:hypothetical protein DL770_005923 [Monosporascus sp. CRB-9-2]